MRLLWWEATDLPLLALPNRTSGYILLALYVLATGYFLVRYGRQLVDLPRVKQLRLVALCLAGFAITPIFTNIENQLFALLFACLALVPLMMTAITLPPVASLLTGLAMGVGYAFWGSHQWLDLFAFGLIGWVVAVALNPTKGTRNPTVIGGLVAAAIWILSNGLTAMVSLEPQVGAWTTADYGLQQVQTSGWPILIAGVVASFLLSILLVVAPGLLEKPRKEDGSDKRPIAETLSRNLLWLSALLFTVLTLATFIFALNSATNQTLEQMARDSDVVSASIPDFQAYGQGLLNQFSSDERLLSQNPEERQKPLSQLFRTGGFYRRVMLVDQPEGVSTAFPEDGVAISLTEREKTAVSRALANNIPLIETADSAESEHIMSFVVPVMGIGGEPNSALVGRVPELSLTQLVNAVQGTAGTGTGFIINENNRVIAHPDNSMLLTSWLPAGAQNMREADRVKSYTVPKLFGAGRELVYEKTAVSPNWRVVLTVPHETVLKRAVETAFPLTVVSLIATLLFGTALNILGQRAFVPLGEMAETADKLADGEYQSPVPEGAGEIGRLGRAYTGMQDALRSRESSQVALRKISRNVSQSKSARDAMPHILTGAHTATGALGVRVVAANPNTGAPMTFSKGSIGANGSAIDRQLTALMGAQEHLMFTNRDALDEMITQSPESPVQSLIAIPLYTHNRFQGIFWAGYDEPRTFSETELALLHTLANQASVLVENSRLFATAETGRRRLAAVLHSTHDAVIVTDPDSRILLVNPAMEASFGLTAKDVLGRNVGEVFKGSPLLTVMRGNEAQNVEVEANGGKLLAANGSDIKTADNTIIGRVAVLHDISQLKALDDMKSDFVAGVSHDLRSPISYIQNVVNMMNEVGELDSNQQKYVDQISSGVARMEHMVENLLDMARLESGIELDIAQVNVKQLLEAVATENAAHAEQQGIEMAYGTDKKLPIIEADLTLLRQAMNNLVGNAIKYAPNSGRVILRAKRGKDRVIISVSDNGPGIDADELPQLFDKFYRGKSSNRKAKGTGLGLALVKTIAERHGGTAWAESQKNVGSTFYMGIPVKK